MASDQLGMGYNLDTESDADIAFGVWLGELRLGLSLSFYDVYEQTQIEVARLRQLEQGEALRGITPAEVGKLADLYEVPSKDIIEKAISG